MTEHPPDTEAAQPADAEAPAEGSAGTAARALAAHGHQLPENVVAAVEASWELAAPELERLRARPVPLGPGYVEPHHGLAWIAASGRSPGQGA